VKAAVKGEGAVKRRGKRASTSSALGGEVGGRQVGRGWDDPGPLPSSGRGLVLAALHAARSEREEIVGFISAISDIYTTTYNGQRSAIVTDLGREHSQPYPLWAQDGVVYRLTTEGEALRDGGTFENFGPRPGAKKGREGGASHSAPQVAEAVLETNGLQGHSQLWRVRWQGTGAGASSWVPTAQIPPHLLKRDLNGARVAFNLGLLPSLADTESTGVERTSVSAQAAHACAQFLATHWRDGALHLTEHAKAQGYATYEKTLGEHSPDEQALHTLLITNALIPHANHVLPGFAQMGEELASWVQRKYDTVVELYFAHGLRQGPHTLKSTGFDVHQDSEDFDFIEYTVVVKLTPDASGEPPSAMRVVGSQEHFHYGGEAGAAGCFLAKLYHASVAPKSDQEHYKIAFFFRKSVKGERRAKRKLVESADSLVLLDAPAMEAADGTDLDPDDTHQRRLASRRQSVMHELSAASVAAVAAENAHVKRVADHEYAVPAAVGAVNDDP